MRINVVGTGCKTMNDGLPEHNPKPSTERGKRRHAKRSEDAKNAAEAAWGKGRSAFPRCRPKQGVDSLLRQAA